MSTRNLPGRRADFAMKGDVALPPAEWRNFGAGSMAYAGAAEARRLPGRRALVTGGASFIGSHIVDRLVDAGCGEIIVVDDLAHGRVANLARAMESGRVRLVVAEIRRSALLADLLHGVDTVFHQLAPDADQDIGGTQAAAEAAATADLLEECVQAGVRKVVMTGPAAAYGTAEGFSVTGMSALPALASPCGAAQGSEANLLRSLGLQHELRLVALRHADVYGPRMSVHDSRAGFLIHWMGRLAAGLPPELPGSGEQHLDLIHVEDVARASLLAAGPQVAGATLDIGGGEGTTLAALAELLMRIMGRQTLRAVPGPATDAPTPRAGLHACTARDQLGFEPSIPLSAGLEELVTWWCTERDLAAPCDMPA